jgi:hypothetical protein
MQSLTVLGCSIGNKRADGRTNMKSSGLAIRDDARPGDATQVKACGLIETMTQVAGCR